MFSLVGLPPGTKMCAVEGVPTKFVDFLPGIDKQHREPAFLELVLRCLKANDVLDVEDLAGLHLDELSDLPADAVHKAFLRRAQGVAEREWDRLQTPEPAPTAINQQALLEALGSSKNQRKLNISISQQSCSQ